MSKNAHILCVAAGEGPGRFAPTPGFTVVDGEIAEVVAGDLWVGPRPYLETLSPKIDENDPLSFISSIVGGKIDKIDFSGLISGEKSLEEIIGYSMKAETVSYPDFVQIIPYYLFRNQGRYFYYLRPDKGSETRLHGKVSIGVGGHVDFGDIVANADGVIDLAATLDLAGKRESAEEIGTKIADQAFRYIGILYAIDTEVDRVHLGIIGICDLTDQQAAELQPNHEIADYGFATLAEIRKTVDADPNKTLETWTRMIIESNPLA